jgi:hypothetical protein
MCTLSDREVLGTLRNVGGICVGLVSFADTMSAKAAAMDAPVSQSTVMRTQRWAAALQLPSSSAYSTLSLQLPPKHLNPVVEAAVGRHFPTAKAQRVLNRVWGYLLIHESGLAHVAAAPFAAGFAARAFPATPVYALEAALHHLLNTASVLTTPALYDSLDAALARRSGPLYRHLHGVGCPPQTYFGVLLERVYFDCFDETEWFQVMDRLLTAPDGASGYFRAAVAVLEHLRAKLMLATSSEQVLRILSTAKCDSVDVKRRLATLHDVIIPLPAATQLFEGPHYPRLSQLIGNVDAPEPFGEAQLQVLHAMAADEQDKSRALQVNLESLEALLRMQRMKIDVDGEHSTEGTDPRTVSPVQRYYPTGNAASPPSPSAPGDGARHHHSLRSSDRALDDTMHRRSVHLNTVARSMTSHSPTPRRPSNQTQRIQSTPLRDVSQGKASSSPYIDQSGASRPSRGSLVQSFSPWPASESGFITSPSASSRLDSAR